MVNGKCQEIGPQTFLTKIIIILISYVYGSKGYFQYTVYLI